MSNYIYLLVPYFSMGMLALSILFKLYKRSISSFMTFMMIAVVSNAVYYGYVEIGLDILVVFMVFLMLRALNKPDNDTIYPKIYRGEEKRNRRRA